MNYFIITGVSRGIGEAITRKLLVHGNVLFCASRTMNEDLVETASSLHIPLYYHETDLSDPRAADAFLHEVFMRLNPDEINRMALINNAGMLEPIGTVESNASEMISRSLMLNLYTPMVLTAGFIARTRELEIPKVIVNVSSGAANYPYSGWSAYCSTKAGLNMFTRTVGLEQTNARFPVNVFSVAPGIVDTSMQTLIRHTDPSQFAEKEFFVRLHDERKLLPPDLVAETIISSLFSKGIENGSNLTLDQLKEMMKIDL
jgi:benzil reductase ((S)-benzoin forming)